MGLVYRVLLACCAMLLFSHLAMASSSCARILETGSLDELRWSLTPVEVIYFPDYQHTKLRLGEDVYSNQCPDDSCVHESIKALDRLPSFGRGPQLRFRLKVTPEELDALRDFIGRGDFERAITFGCTYSVCRAINQATQAWIPVPFNLTPFLNGVYLTASRFTPGTRVSQVTLTVPRKNGEPAFQLTGWKAIRYTLSARRIK